MGRNRRSSYLEHFHRNAAGEYIYSGDYYAYATQEIPRRRALGELWLYTGLALAAFLTGGCIRVPGLGDCAYVLLPYMGGSIAAGSLIWTMGQLSAGGDPLREYVYQVTVKRLPRRMLIMGAAACLSLVGEGAYLLLHGGAGRTGLGVLFMALEALAAVCGALGRRRGRGLSWTKTEK